MQNDNTKVKKFKSSYILQALKILYFYILFWFLDFDY